jgi:plasmid maintenance system antidote protein VapI
MQGSNSGSLTGGVIVGLLMAHNIPRKALADQLNVNEATLSRQINDKVQMQPEYLIQVGMAIGHLKTKKAL